MTPVHRLTTTAQRFEAARQLARRDLPVHWQRLHGHSFAVQARAPAQTATDHAGGRHALHDTIAPWHYSALHQQLTDVSDEGLARHLLDRTGPGVRTLRLRSAPGHGVIATRDGDLQVWRSYRFESAHWLPHVPPGHKCGRLHGHGFVARLFVRGAGMADYARLDAAWAPLQERLNGRCLNDTPGLDNPTSENLAAWIWAQLQPKLAGLAAVCVHETATCGAHFDGTDYRIWKSLTLDSATTDGDRDAAVLGHTYALRLHLRAPLDEVLGWGVDFGDVKAVFAPLYAQLDHQPLHQLPELAGADPGSLAEWILQRASGVLPALERVDLYSTPGSGHIVAQHPALDSL